MIWKGTNECTYWVDERHTALSQKFGDWRFFFGVGGMVGGIDWNWFPIISVIGVQEFFGG